MKTEHHNTVLLLATLCLALSSCVNDTPKTLNDGVVEGRYHGIDVSHHQGTIDWEKVSSDTCIQFVYIKATQGSTFQDPEYKTNMKQAQKHGLKCGSYHYFTMLSKSDAQFDNFKRTTAGYTQDLIPMVDVELDNKKDKNGWKINGVHTSKRMPKERERVILTLSNLLNLFEKEYGCKPIIYCTYAAYVQVIKGEFEDYPIFLASYRSQAHFDDYLIWQYSEKGHVDGIEGYVDLDRFHEGVTLKDIELR